MSRRPPPDAPIVQGQVEVRSPVGESPAKSPATLGALFVGSPLAEAAKAMHTKGGQLRLCARPSRGRIARFQASASPSVVWLVGHASGAFEIGNLRPGTRLLERLPVQRATAMGRPRWKRRWSLRRIARASAAVGDARPAQGASKTAISHPRRRRLGAVGAPSRAYGSRIASWATGNTSPRMYRKTVRLPTLMSPPSPAFPE